MNLELLSTFVLVLNVLTMTILMFYTDARVTQVEDKIDVIVSELIKLKKEVEKKG